LTGAARLRSRQVFEVRGSWRRNFVGAIVLAGARMSARENARAGD